MRSYYSAPVLHSVVCILLVEQPPREELHHSAYRRRILHYAVGAPAPNWDMLVHDQLPEHPWDVGGSAFHAVVGVLLFYAHPLPDVNDEPNQEMHAVGVYSFVHVVQEFAEDQVGADKLPFFRTVLLFLGLNLFPVFE